MHPAGFTLLEMLVVLAILGLIAGLAFPAVERAQRRQAFLAAAAQVELAVRQARVEAMRRGTIETAVMPAALPSGARLETSRREGLRFYRDGTANGAAIRITDGVHRFRLTVDPDTGRVRSARS